MPAATVSVEVEPHDTVIYPADGPNVDRVGAQNLLSHGSTLYLNTGTTEPGLLLSETGGASWRSQPIELSHLPPPPEGRSHDVAGFFVTSCAPSYAQPLLPAACAAGGLLTCGWAAGLGCCWRCTSSGTGSARTTARRRRSTSRAAWTPAPRGRAPCATWPHTPTQPRQMARLTGP